MNSVVIVDICAPESTRAKHSTSSIKICVSFTCTIGSGLWYCFLIDSRVMKSVWVGFAKLPLLFDFFDSGGRH